MKNLTLAAFFTLVCLFTAASTYAQNQGDENENCLEFIGKFDGTVKDLSGLYTIQLIQDNKVMKEQTISVTASFRFVLKRNMLYTVKLEKQGYISKTVSVSTVLPKKIEIENLYTFKLETNLLSQDLQGHFKDDDLDFPVALVSYGKKCDCFEYNRDYTAKLINSMYNNLVFGN
jgi:hypothetical protein